MRVKAWKDDVLVADYMFEELIDGFIFASSMRAKNYKIKMERSNV